MDNELTQLTNALNKAMESTSNIAQAMAITYDDNIAFKTFQYSPFLQVLEDKGSCTDVDNANVSFFKETPTNDATFINETEDIPDYAVTTYEEVSDRMKVIAEGISISHMAQIGTDAVDLLEREIERAYMQVNSLIDKTLLDGTGTTAAKNFKKVWADIPSNNITDMSGAPVTEDAIDDTLTQIVDECGGHPDILVTDNFVAKQLKAIAAPYRRYNDKTEIGLGFKVSTYESPDGLEIPIVVDKNMPVTSGKHKILFADSSAISVKYLMRPSLFTDLQANNLAYNQAVASYVTAYNVAPFKCGMVDNIGAPAAATSNGDKN